MTDDMNNNDVNVIVNNLFDDQALVDTGSFLSFVDNNFCKIHNLCVNSLQSGELKSYFGVGESTITAIGSTNIELTFARVKFLHNFWVFDHLVTNILIGVDFICKYNCVAYVFRGVFYLGDAQITVPLVVKGDTLGLAKLEEQGSMQPNTQRVVRVNGPNINEQSVFLLKPIFIEICRVYIAQENTPSASNIDEPCYFAGEEQRDYPGPNGYRNRQRRYSALTGEEQRDYPRPNGYRIRHRRYLAD